MCQQKERLAGSKIATMGSQKGHHGEGMGTLQRVMAVGMGVGGQETLALSRRNVLTRRLFTDGIGPPEDGLPAVG